MNVICDSHVQWRCIPGQVHHVFKLLQENFVEHKQSSQLVENLARDAPIYSTHKVLFHVCCLHIDCRNCDMTWMKVPLHDLIYNIVHDKIQRCWHICWHLNW